jgi:arylsulfatase A-like enzyme
MVTQTSDTAGTGRRDTNRFVAFPLWLALVGAGVEVIVLFLRKSVNPLLRISEDFVWMAPLALLTLTLLIVGTFLLVRRFWRSPLVPAVAVFAAAFATFLNLLLLIPGLAHYALAIVAAGLGVQTSRLVQRHPESVARLVRRSSAWVLAAVVLSGGLIWTALRPAAGAGAATSAVSANTPNVLLITLDTLRAANMSLYGYTRTTTPRLDRFAERGVVFERALASSPWTLPSHASLFTGRWPHELSANYDAPLDGTYPTLAEFLAVRGYATAGFVANLGYCSFATGLGRGFHHYEDYPRSLGQIASSSTLFRTVLDNFTLRAQLRNDEHLNRVTAPALNARALDWLSAQHGRPFFMFLNYFDTHEPYLPPPPFDRQFGPGRQRGRYSPLRRWLWDPKLADTTLDDAQRREEMDAYDGAMAYLDHHVGLFLDELDRRGILENTIIVITSDHGEEFGEHGVYEHGYSLYRAGVHVPLIVVAPQGIPEHLRIRSPVSLRSLAATVVDLLGLGAGAPFPGRSFANLWRDARGEPAPGAGDLEPLLSEVSRAAGQRDWYPTSKGDMKALVEGGVRYIRNGDGTEELYNFDRDAAEQHNLAALPEHGDALAKARRLLDQLIAPKRPAGR